MEHNGWEVRTRETGLGVAVDIASPETFGLSGWLMWGAFVDLFLMFGAWALQGAIDGPRWAGSPSQPVGFFLGPVFLLIGSATLLSGLQHRWGRSEIEVTAQRIVRRMSLGRLGWRSTRQRSALRAVRIQDEYRHAGIGGGQKHVLALQLVFEPEQDNVEVQTGDWRLLRAIGEALAEALGDPELLCDTTMAREWLMQRTIPMSVPAAPPAKTKIRMERTAEGLALHVPRFGFRGGVGVNVFALFWLGFTLTIGSLLFVQFVKHPSWRLAAVVFLLGQFSVVGASMWHSLISWATRRAEIRVEGNRLAIQRRTLFARRVDEWSGGVRMVHVEPVGDFARDTPRLQLVVLGEGGPHRSFFPGWSQATLDWIAATLCTELRINSTTDEPRRL